MFRKRQSRGHRQSEIAEFAHSRPCFKLHKTTIRLVLTPSFCCVYEQGRLYADATDAAALGPAPQGAPRHGGWSGSLFLPDTPCARELWKGLEISLLANNHPVWMNDEFSLFFILRYQKCSILMQSVTSALHHVPLFTDRIWCYYCHLGLK